MIPVVLKEWILVEQKTVWDAIGIFKTTDISVVKIIPVTESDEMKYFSFIKRMQDSKHFVELRPLSMLNEQLFLISMPKGSSIPQVLSSISEATQSKSISIIFKLFP
jgi:hypothetical protein